MFTTIIVQPIFNLLVLIYAILPGHNFGLAIIIFTILVRLALWPLVKKQLHNAKAMRALAPELKRIKAAAKGDRQKVSAMTMELYKERGINPFSSIVVMLAQLPILIGLYISVRKIVEHPHELVSFTYPAIQHLSWMQTIAHDISQFDDSLVGIVNLGQKALENGHIYWPAFVIVVASAIAQFFQTKQLMPQAKDSRSLKSILRDAGKGQNADQSEVNAAVGRSTMYIIPGFVFFIYLGFPAALPLYWLTSSLVAIIQQSRVLREDVEEAEAEISVTPRATKTKSGLKVYRKTIDSEVKPAAKAKKSSSPKKRASRRRRK